MSAPTVSRRDITLDEDLPDAPTFGDIAEHADLPWEARLYGRVSTGEQVEMTRSGSTSSAAYAALKAAIEEQGWTIRERGMR